MPWLQNIRSSRIPTKRGYELIEIAPDPPAQGDRIGLWLPKVAAPAERSRARRLPEINRGSYVGLIVRHDFSVAGNPARADINNLILEPQLNIGLPTAGFSTRPRKSTATSKPANGSLRPTSWWGGDSAPAGSPRWNTSMAWCATMIAATTGSNSGSDISFDASASRTSTASGPGWRNGASGPTTGARTSVREG